MEKDARDVAELLRGELSKDRNVLLAYLFGSHAQRSVTPLSDVDVAVLLRDNDLERIGELWSRLAKALSMTEDKVDLVDLSRADLQLKYSIVSRGVKLVEREAGLEKRIIKELNEKYPETRMLQEISLREWLSSADPSKVDISMVKRRLNEAGEEVGFLEDEVSSKTVEEVASSRIYRRLLERSVHVIAETLIDVCRHIVSVKGWGPVETYADLVELMRENNVITYDLSRELKKLVAWRNIIVHRYLSIDHKRLYEDSRRLRNTVSEFEKQIVNYIRKRQGRVGAKDE